MFQIQEENGHLAPLHPSDLCTGMHICIYSCAYTIHIYPLDGPFCILLNGWMLSYSLFIFLTYPKTNFILEQEDEEASTGSHLKLIVDAFLQQLPNCVNRDLIDKVFFFFNELFILNLIIFKKLKLHHFPLFPFLPSTPLMLSSPMLSHSWPSLCYCYIYMYV